ncbi:DEAD/DEAH box helicase family protein [uncultured Sphaerochaeta sp.]|uniref:DEAD/DEAH box helicase family protein n=1 Tax=uncultured Sphaerochaeta sp. TaxID=886478 RepID=UPI002A0A4439|nr:DEAD/DEAH box helicase family protein [uncultured Sphaerochaeta sp.]
MSNFNFLQQEYSSLYPHAKRTEELALKDPRGSCFYARLTLEHTVEWLYEHDRSLRRPYDNQLGALIHENTFQQLLPESIFAKVKAIQRAGNQAAHSNREIRELESQRICQELFHVLYWVARTYTLLSDPKELNVEFNPKFLITRKKVKIVKATTTSLKKIEEAYKKERETRDKEVSEREEIIQSQAKTLTEREDILAELDEELARTRAELAEAKSRNIRIPDTHDYSEYETRKLIIDQLLIESGWSIGKDVSEEFPVQGMPTHKGEGFVDYVLWGNNGLPLAVVEAKKTTVDPYVGQQQAKLYADCLQSMKGQRPIIFFTNGYESWIWDDDKYPPRKIQGFYTIDQLQLLVERRTLRKALYGQDVNRNIVDRPYQIRVIQSLCESFESSQRKGLLAMATGSGKTRTVIALVDLLMRNGWVKRVLFLADRVALVNQAVNSFKIHLPQSSPVNLVTEKDSIGRVYVSTYPTMMGLIDQFDDSQRKYGVGYFDLIVIDEAHRSVYKKYGAIFDYFDSLLVGLTATPRDEVHHDTYRMFDLETGLPTDAYSLKEAIDDKYLVPYKAISVPLKFQREGIKYDELSEDEKAQWEELDWGDEEIPEAVDSSAVNKWLFNEDTVDKVLKYLMENGQKIEAGDKLGKTIIFAKNHDHAAFIQKRFDIHYPHLKGHFARVIDNRVKYAQSLIDDFSTPDKYPQLAISVDMLDTGIDVPQILNLVFFKIVKSKTKFHQMIGRGTRLCPDLFAKGVDKESFTIFDFCTNLEYFGENPDGTVGNEAIPLAKKNFLHRLQLIQELQELSKAEELSDELEKLGESIRDHLHNEVSSMNISNFIVRPKRKYVEQYNTRDRWTTLSNEAISDLAHHVAGLPTELDAEDITARVFDNTCLQLQLAVLHKSTAFLMLQKRVRDIASNLEEKTSIPMVKAQIELIANIQTDEFWEGVTLPLIESIRRKLRDLVQFVDKQKQNIVYSDFKDELGESVEWDTLPSNVGIDIERYKKKVEAYILAHRNHITINKLYRNEPLTSTDLSELERFLYEADVIEGREKFETAYGEQQNLSRFIRSLVGLDRGAAKNAFGKYLDGTRFNATQIRFIEMIIDHLTKNGVMNPGRLYEQPFTGFHYEGLEGVFESAAAGEIIEILQLINANAG